MTEKKIAASVAMLKVLEAWELRMFMVIQEALLTQQ